jgi:hypothetical protein
MSKNKKYDFNKILKEYNEKYNRKCKPPSNMSDITIVHNTESDTFHVTYANSIDWESYKKPLNDFLHFDVSSSIHWLSFYKIMLSKEEKKLDIKIWPPSKIRYAYLSTNYATKDVGVLGKSCMRSKEMQKSLNFYVKNNVRIVVVVDSKNKIHARALLWGDIKNTRTKKVCAYLDRVYSNSDALSLLFHKLAEENKWGDYGSSSAGNAKSGWYKDNLDIKDMCHFPWADTFRYLYYKDNLVASSSMLKQVKYGDCVSLTVASGRGYFPNLDPNRVKEALTGSFISKKDATFIKRYKGYVLKEHIVDIKGDYYSSRDTKIVQNTDLDGYILKKDFAEEVLTKQPINKAAAIHSIKYNGFIHKSNIVNIEGEVYHKKDTNIICFDNKWYHISQCLINYDREERNKEAEKLLFCACRPQSYELRANVMSKDKPIPKKLVLIAYDLFYNPLLNNIEYQEVYCTNKDNLVQLVTGELIVNSAKNKKLLKKFNNKYYIRQTFKQPDGRTIILSDTEQTFKPPNKKQLMLF